jgi:putative flippase GtrA
MTVGIGGLGQRVGRSGRLLIKELGAFGVVGVFSFLLDIAVFQLLYANLGVGAVTSKFLATVLSMTVAYFGHRYWSFSHRARTGVRREYLLFVMINGSTLLLGMAVVALVRYPLGQDDALILQAANIASIVLSTALRYVAYRRWVFPAHAEPATEASASASRIVA